MINIKIIQIIILSVLLSACGAMKPAPIYNSGSRNSGSSNKSSAVKKKDNPALASAATLSSPVKRLMLDSINKYRGVPYKWGGETRRGMDCSGFTMKVFEESAKYSMPHRAELQYKLGSKVNRRQLKFGDLVFFRDIESKGISHVGIYVGDDNFVHASLSKGVIYSSLNQEYYRSRYVSARRVLR